jgi:hypothetical protein
MALYSCLGFGGGFLGTCAFGITLDHFGGISRLAAWIVSSGICGLAEAIVDGRNAQHVVRFDGWVDHGASQMDITENGKIVESLVPTRDSEPDVLAAAP